MHLSVHLQVVLRSNLVIIEEVERFKSIFFDFLTYSSLRYSFRVSGLYNASLFHARQKRVREKKNLKNPRLVADKLYSSCILHKSTMHSPLPPPFFFFFLQCNFSTYSTVHTVYFHCSAICQTLWYSFSMSC